MVMEKIEFPFLMEFKRSFKDHNIVYFLSEYVKGAELFDVMREMGTIDAIQKKLIFFIKRINKCY